MHVKHCGPTAKEGEIRSFRRLRSGCLTVSLSFDCANPFQAVCERKAEVRAVVWSRIVRMGFKIQWSIRKTPSHTVTEMPQYFVSISFGAFRGNRENLLNKKTVGQLSNICSVSHRLFCILKYTFYHSAILLRLGLVALPILSWVHSMRSVNSTN